jgi:nucleoside phosphorylase
MAQPPLETFQIGWICALPIEAAAAKEMLDENFGILDVQDPSDSNTYTLGRIGKHHVAIACLPGGQYGTTSATTVANNMVRTFSKSLRVGLMVGVGGGIPSAAHDIRLGDVVISCPEGTSGGVLQYDMGKVGTNGEFQRTGSLNSPPRALLTATNLMRAAELTDDPYYPEYLLKAIGRTARTQKNFGRPKQDRLFKLEHIHPTTASTCDGCLTEWEETRSERETSDPQSYYGIIASGNAVIKDGYTREQLRLDTGALCFEMEAAGLMMDFPCIVVRGICDYADTHKNKQWQGYAALAAASYAKELLGYIPTTHVSQENLVVDIYCKYNL